MMSFGLTANISNRKRKDGTTLERTPIKLPV
jgi:hypothetical protein